MKKLIPLLLLASIGCTKIENNEPPVQKDDPVIRIDSRDERDHVARYYLPTKQKQP